MSKNLSCSYTIVGILSFISMIYTTSESFFSLYEQLKSFCSTKLSMKKVYNLEAWPRGYKTFFALNSTKHKCILVKNVKMQTIVGILTFISMISTTSGSLKARIF